MPSLRKSIVSAREARIHWSELLGKVQAGEEIVITKHGVPVARLVRSEKHADPRKRLAVIRRINKLASSLSLGRWKLHDLIREGRR